VKTVNNFSISIHTVLRELIDAKSKRDNIKFTSYQLASALAMPRSIITKLLHADISKRVSNPKIETLIKIIDFFREDGFNVNIDDLLNLKSKSVDVQSQLITSNDKIFSVVLYSFANMKNKIGTIEVAVSNTTKNLIALQASEDIEPFFKRGSIFIIDSEIKPTNETLIAIQLDNMEKIHIRKYVKIKNKIFLKSLANEDDIILPSATTCKILGVIIQINART